MDCLYLQIIKLKKVLMNRKRSELMKAVHLVEDLNGQEMRENKDRDTKAGCHSVDQP